MHVQRDSFFRIFSSELRGALQYFFENRRARISPEIASEFVDLATLERLVAVGLIEFDGESGEYAHIHHRDLTATAQRPTADSTEP